LGIGPINALNVVCAQLTLDLFAIAKFLFYLYINRRFTLSAPYIYYYCSTCCCM